MKCTILSIGDELLIGQTLNTNAYWMSQKMNEIGIDVIHHVSLSDEKSDIINCLNDALAASQVILITGGLGPTSDDITKEVLCEYFGGKLVFNEEAFRNIERIFASRKRLINEASRRVAYLPDVCKVIPNSNGTAAGMIFTKDAATQTESNPAASACRTSSTGAVARLPEYPMFSPRRIRCYRPRQRCGAENSQSPGRQ